MKTQDKTVLKHAMRINRRHKFERSEIGAICKLISGSRFAEESRRADVFRMLETYAPYQTTVDLYRHGRHFAGEVHLFKEPCRITSKQTVEGKTWLRNRYIRKDGRPRLCVERELSERSFGIVETVSRFEFVGILVAYHDSGFGKHLSEVLPIYRAFNRRGQYFDYSPIHWSEPVIMEGL